MHGLVQKGDLMNFAAGFLLGLIRAVILHYLAGRLYRLLMEKRFGPVTLRRRIWINFFYHVFYIFILMPSALAPLNGKLGVMAGVSFILFAFVPLLERLKNNSR